MKAFGHILFGEINLIFYGLRKLPVDPTTPFAHWAGPRNAKMVFVGEAWGSNEAEQRAPFVGASGQELWRMIGEAAGEALSESHSRASRMMMYGNGWIRHRNEWLAEAGVAFTNVLNLRPPGNKLEYLCKSKKELPADYVEPHFAGVGKYLAPEYFPHVDRLQQELGQCSPNLVVALGNSACWALLRKTNIGSIRGAIGQSVDGLKILPTYHPAGVLRQWSWRTIVVADLIKAWRECEFPEVRRPRRQIVVNPSLDEVEFSAVRIIATARRDNSPIAFDIETRAGQVTCISFASSPDFALVIPFVDMRTGSGSYWPGADEELSAWNVVGRILEDPSLVKLAQNGVYDLFYLARMGFRPQNCTEDTMLFHHSLFPEMRKGLGFLGSIYTNEPAWKLMRTQKADSVKRDE